MKFSPVVILVAVATVIAVVCIWLGVIWSQSTLVVELATAATNLFLLLSVALAIWQPQRALRVFWTGFCLVGLGSLILGNYFSAYEGMRTAITNAVVGGSQPQEQVPAWGTTAIINGRVNGVMSGYDPYGSTVTYSQPGGPYSPYGGVGLPNLQLQTTLLAAIPPMFSLLAASIGGLLALWITRLPKTEVVR